MIPMRWFPIINNSSELYNIIGESTVDLSNQQINKLFMNTYTISGIETREINNGLSANLMWVNDIIPNKERDWDE